MSDSITLVTFLPDDKPHPCGYCKEKSSLSNGMWAHYLSVSVYKQLLDNGWRRSGRYVYKPDMEKTCCPLYTIRCEAQKFKPTKSQKKVAKKVRNFLLRGSKKSSLDNKHDVVDQAEQETKCSNADKISVQDDTENYGKHKNNEDDKVVDVDWKSLGLRKAKIRRLEKRIEKGGNENKEKEKLEQKNKGKSINDYVPNLQTVTDQLNATVSQVGEEFKHKFELRLIKADQRDSQFKNHFEESYNVYKKYQMCVHGDSEEECDQETYQRFLCDSPLNYCYDPANSDILLGAFHQHYLIDGKIIAVGVIDLLPECLSSVYFYYDPSFSHLSLGTYSAIREIQLCSTLDRKYYYMGYYIHSCHKMRYKGKYYPSELLSPTSYKWHPIEKCLPILDETKYSTFESDEKLQHLNKTVDKSKCKIYMFGDFIKYSEELYERVCEKNKSMLNIYFDTCDNIAERMTVTLNEQQDYESTDEDED